MSKRYMVQGKAFDALLRALCLAVVVLILSSSLLLIDHHCSSGGGCCIICLLSSSTMLGILPLVCVALVMLSHFAWNVFKEHNGRTHDTPVHLKLKLLI